MGCSVYAATPRAADKPVNMLSPSIHVIVRPEMVCVHQQLTRPLALSCGAGSCERKRDQLTALLRETIKIIAMVEDLVGEEQTCGCRRLAVQPCKAFEHHADA